MSTYAHGQMRRPLYLLVAGALLVLLIGCVNIASSLLARLSSRQREMALRSALGASTGQLVRQLVVECGVLAAAGGAAGILLAAATTRVLGRWVRQNVNPLLDLHSSGWTPVFAAVLSLATMVAMAVLPAVAGARREGVRRDRAGRPARDVGGPPRDATGARGRGGGLLHRPAGGSIFPEERQPRGPEDFVQVFRHSVNPGALGNLGIALLSGRDFNRFDTAQSSPVAIVSQSVAGQLWPGEEAVGKQLKLPDPTRPPIRSSA